MASITLKPGREKSLVRRHPWVFSGAIASRRNVRKAGQTVDVLGADGTWLARGAVSPTSQIYVRVWSFDSQQEIGPDFFRERIATALGLRSDLLTESGPAACRLVNGESDGLPGLIVDRYGDFLVAQFLAAGVERWKRTLVEVLLALQPCTGIYERSDVPIREKEGLGPTTGLLAGMEPPDLVEITEGPVRFLVDLRHGHKTGFYLDQRENRALVGKSAGGAAVLNCFAYTGGFGLCALAGGAEHVTQVETSAEALNLAARHLELNGLPAARAEHFTEDVFAALRRFRTEGREFDLIVLDPPKFAASAGQVTKASRGYKDINLLALKLLRTGGHLFTFSCSGHVTADLFQKIVAGAALDSGRQVQIVRWLRQAVDHPVALAFPEGAYLKGLLCRVV